MEMDQFLKILEDLEAIEAFETQEYFKEYHKENPRPQSKSSKAWHKEFRERDPKGYRKYMTENQFKSRYGITHEDRDRMIEEQNNKCLICGVEFGSSRNRTVPNVDHCHSTGKVRGILCNRCNVGLGHFLDDPDLMLKAIEYLNEGDLT